MAKINVARNATDEILDDLISNISTYSNAQSKVTKVDLRARSSQLVKLKSLSESVLTLTSKKWFFERAKGEYATMIRINFAKKSLLERTFPKERRFTKEELAKYYCAWGDRPYAVKKGGEKIFRLFLEEISGEGKTKKIALINRAFYEDLVARIILFRGLEKIYGSGINSLGQLRSAVVPYSLSTLFVFTTGNKKAQPFDLLKIWKAEKLENDLQLFFKSLMKLMNKLIKKFSKSDDLGEYSKKLELWEDIIGSKELAGFMEENSAKVLLKRYTIPLEEIRKREKAASNEDSIDFEPLLKTAAVFDRGVNFYSSIESEQSSKLSALKLFKLNAIITAIQQNKTIEESHLEFENELLRMLSINSPDLLSQNNPSDVFKATVGYILKKYNSAIASGRDVQASFNAVKELANKKGVRNYSVFGEIGKKLQNNELPSMLQIKQASDYFKLVDSM